MANAASTPILTSAPTVGFPQFPRLPENLLESGDGRPGGDDFILFSGQNLERQIRRASTLLRVNKETRQLVQDALPNTIQFRRFSPMSEPNQPPDPVDASIRFSKDTDIIWLEFPPRLADFHFPAHLNTFRLCDGAKAARNVGFVLPDGRRTLLDPMTRFTTPHMLKQFSGLENFYYGLAHDDLVEAGRERYLKCGFRDADCHIFSLDAEEDAFYHSSGSDWEKSSDVGIEVLYGHFGLTWHWPKPGSQTEERIPCVISKVVRPIQSTIDELGWRCIPIFEFDDIYDTHNQLLREATLGQALPELPDGSEISEAGSEIFEPGYPSHPHGNAGDCDCDCPVHGHEEPPSGILGARPNPLPYELRDWKFMDEEIGYQDSDEGESLEDDQEAPAFHKFTNLPIELRYQIWEAYCPDLTTPGRVFEFDITNPGPDNEPSNYKAYAGETTQDVTRKIRKVLAIHRQSRNMALGLLPDTLDFNIRPGDSSDYPAASLRFRKETDIICFKRPPTTQVLKDGLPKEEQKFTLPGFSDIVRNIAAPQPPEAPLFTEYHRLIMHLIDQFPNLANYYYVLAPNCVPSKDMAWSVVSETTRFSQLRLDLSRAGYPLEKEMWCWLTKDAAHSAKATDRVRMFARPFESVTKERGINLLPMTILGRYYAYYVYITIVEEEEQARLRAGKGEPDPDEVSNDGAELTTAEIEQLINRVLDGTIPGGIPMLQSILQQAGVQTRVSHLTF